MTRVNAQRLSESGNQSDAAFAPSLAAKVFDPIIQSLHWLTLLLIVCMFLTASLIDEAPSDAAKAVIIQLHRSLGLTVWAVTVTRLIWRQFANLPDWPANMPRFFRVAASLVEYLLYSLLLLQPILGLLYTNAHGNKVHLFFLVYLPRLFDQDDELGEQLIAAHEAAAKVLLAAVALHACAALYHHFLRRDNTLNRMLPRALRRQPREEWHR